MSGAREFRFSEHEQAYFTALNSDLNRSLIAAGRIIEEAAPVIEALARSLADLRSARSRALSWAADYLKKHGSTKGDTFELMEDETGIHGFIVREAPKEMNPSGKPG